MEHKSESLRKKGTIHVVKPNISNSAIRATLKANILFSIYKTSVVFLIWITYISEFFLLNLSIAKISWPSCIYIYIYIYIYMYIYVCVCVCVCVCLYECVYTFGWKIYFYTLAAIYQCIYLLLKFSLSLSIYIYIYICVCVCVCVCVCTCVCVCMWASIFMFVFECATITYNKQ